MVRKIRQAGIEVKFSVEYECAEHSLEKAQASDAGYDIKANVTSDVVLQPGEYKIIDTALRLALPDGLEAQLRPRSGLAAKHGITVLNSAGTVDARYRGEIRVTLMNHGKDTFTIRKGDKIAQLVFAQVLDTATIRVAPTPKSKVPV